MKQYFLILLSFILFLGAFQFPEAHAQCPTQASVVLKTHTDISCFGANDGTITVDLADASTTTPYNFELYDLGTGSIVTLSVTEVEDKPNRSVVYSDVPPGTYAVLFFKMGCPTLNIIEPPFGFVIDEPPVLTLTGSDVLLNCGGTPTGSGSFTAGGGTPGYSFVVDSNTTGATTSTTATTLDFINAGVGSIMVTVTDANGCNVQHTINVTQPPALTLGTTADVLLACNGDMTATGTFTAGGGTPGYSFTVDSNTTGGTTSTTATTLDFINAGAGSITVTVTDNNGCTAQATINVTQPPALTLGTTGNILLSCNGDTNGSGTFTAGGGTAPYGFTVDTNTTGGTTSTTATTLDFINAGIGVITVTVTDNNGCTAQSTINVTEPPVLTLTGADVSTTCNGVSDASGTFTAGGGTPGYSFVVDSNTTGGTTSTTATTLDFINAGAGVIMVTVTDANGCNVQHTINVTEPALLTLGTTADVLLACNGDMTATGTFTAGGGTPGYSFTVDSNTTGGTTSTTATTLDFVNAGVGSITVTVTDANGCTAQSTINVTQPPALTLGTTGDVLLLCNGDTNGTGTFTAGGGTAPYGFTVDSNTTGGTVNPPTATTIDFVNAGVGVVTITVTDNNGCTAQSTITITEPPALTLTGADVSTTCNGGSDASGSFTAGGGTPGYSFVVDSNTTGATTTTTATTLDFINAGVGSIMVTVTDANGCNVQHTINVTQPPALTLGTTADVLLACNGDMTATGTFTAGGGTPGYSFTVDSNTTGGTTSTTATTLDFVNAGVGSITVTVTDANGCTAQSTINVTQPPALTLGTTGDVLLLCNGDTNGTGTFTAGGGTAPYGFTVDSNTTGGTVNAPTATTIDFVNAGIGVVTITVTDNNGCTAQSTITITEPPALTLTGADVSTTCNGVSDASGTFTAGGGTPGYSFVVDSNTTGGTTSTTATTLDFINAGAGVIMVTVTDANGCNVQHTINVTEPALLTLGTTADVLLACNGDMTATGTFTAGGGTPGYTFTVDSNTTGGTTSTTATTLDFVNAGVGSITVTVTDANGCTAQSTINVTQPSALTLATTADVLLLCNGDANGTGTFTAGGGTAPYSFAVDNNTTGGTVNPPTATTIDFVNAGAGLVTVTVTDANGCTAQSTINVTEPPVLALTTTGNVLLNCNGDTNGTGTFTAGGGTPGYSFVVDSNTTGGTTSTTATTLDVANAAIGAITVTVTDANGCTSQSTITFTEPTAVMITSTVKTDATCLGLNDGAIQISSSGGTGIHQFSIDNGATFQASNTFSGLAPATYNAVVRDANGCTSSATPIIVNNATPITITSTSPTNATCIGVNDGSIDVTGVTGGTGTYTYSNDNGATFQASSTFAGLAVGSYDIVAKDGNNCLSPAVSVAVGNNTVMTFTATPTAATCLGINDGSISTTGEAGGVAPYTYSIDNGVNFQASANFNSLAPGNYDVVIRDVNLCLSAASTIVVGNGSTITINTVVSNGTSCATSNDGSIDITSVTGGTPPYMYSIDNGATFQVATLFGSLAAANYNVVVMDNNGCLSSPQVQSVAAGTAVTATVNKTDATCADNDGSITISGETGGAGPYQYSINNGVSYQATGVFSGLSSGSYNVVVMESGGCVSAAQPITINLPPSCTPTGNCATVVITPVATAAICSPTDGKVMFNINPATPAINNTGVRIDIVGVSASNSGVSLTNFNDPFFTGLPIGTYSYTIEYGDPSCIKTGQVTVLLGPDVVDFTVAPNSVNCFGSAGGVVLSNINGSSLADYSYQVIQSGAVVQTGNITQLESLGDVTITGLGSGNFEIKLSQDQSATTSCTSPVQSALKPFSVTSPTAALDTLYVTKKISVPDLPTGSMVVGIAESLQEPYEVRLELTAPLFPGQVFAQDFTVATRNPLNLKIEFQAPNLYPGGYLLSLRDAIGCRKDYAVNISVDNNLMIPNIFTPNGDGVNEVFFIRNKPDDTEVIVSNRWGKQVYSSKNYQNDWDGGDIADGVYYYRIKAGGQSYSGWVELLRGK